MSVLRAIKVTIAITAFTLMVRKSAVAVMPSKAVRQKNFERNTNLIEAFCDENQVQFEKLNDGYQIRLEGMLDLYPVRGRWHNIKTGERGDWNGYKDLRRVMLMALEMLDPKRGVVGKVDVVEVDDPNPPYIPTTDTFQLEVVQTHWAYDRWWDRLLRRKTYYHKLRGQDWAFKSGRWFKPKEIKGGLDETR